MRNDTLRLFVLGTGWGVPFPTAAPFPLKLATWMRMAGIEFEWVEENNPGKGPKGKSPWIEFKDVRMGDSTLIVEYLTKEFDVPDFDASLTPAQRSLSTAVQRMLEEHYHQCFEHQLFFGRGGSERMAEFSASLPPVLNILISRIMVRAFTKQLHARGMGRHPEAVIIQQGKDDLDALNELLGENEFFHGSEPSMIDACIFGFLGVTVYVAGDNPLYRHAASQPRLMAYAERMRSKFFPESFAKLPLIGADVPLSSERSAA